MNWIQLNSEQQLDDILVSSKIKPQVIFKHSTRCSISSMAKSRLERSSVPDDLDFHYLDLIKHRNLSNKIEAVFSVQHESPQILMIKDATCVYSESHSGISMDEIAEQMDNA